MSDFDYFTKLVDQKILNVHTAFLAKVISVKGKSARLQPLSMYKAVGGTAQQPSVVTAVVPENIKYKREDITYQISAAQNRTTTVLVPDELKTGDIVYVGVCERDISYAQNGIIAEATNRHHSVNDSVILQVL